MITFKQASAKADELLKQHQSAVPDYVALGQALREMRVKAGVSQKLMADVLGVSNAFVCDCEYGRRKIKPPMIIAYLRACS